MKLFVLLLVFFQVLYSTNAQWQQTVKISQNDISYMSDPLIDKLASYYSPNLSITVVTPYPVQICFVLYPSHNFAGCDSTNSFTFTPKTNSTQPDLASNWLSEANQINLREDFFGEHFDMQFEKYLTAAPKVVYSTLTTYGIFRSDTPYYIVAQWAGSGSYNDSITVTVQTTSSCQNGQIWILNDGCVTPISGSISQPFNGPQQITANASAWFSFNIDQNPRVGFYYNSLTLKLGSITNGSTVTEAAADTDYYLDFYLSKNSPPTTKVYDLYARLTRLQPLVVAGDINTGTTYYILAVNGNNQQLTITAITTTTECPIGKFGLNCTVNPTSISGNSSTTVKVTGDGSIMYFNITTKELLFGVGIEKLDSAAPPIYADINTVPDPRFSLLKNDDTNSSDSVRLFWTPSINVQATHWVIAVNTTSNQEFYYWANTHCAYDCTPQNTKNPKTKGTCDQSTGKCTCPSGYQYLWCDKKGFPGWAIALIVVAVILLIICLIGIPLVVYLRKRRVKYEQV